MRMCVHTQAHAHAHTLAGSSQSYFMRTAFQG